MAASNGAASNGGGGAATHHLPKKVGFKLICHAPLMPDNGLLDDATDSPDDVLEVSDRGAGGCPPISLYTMVPRTGGYTRTTLGFEICPSFKGLSLSRRAEPLSYDSLPFSSLYLARMLPSPLTSTSSHRCRWCLSGSWRPALSFMLRVALRCSIVLASGAP